VNLVPVPLENGASSGYLKPAEGLVELCTGTGETRGMINWNGVLYAVHGTSLVMIDANFNVTVLGTIADGGTVSMAYDFNVLAVLSGNRLYYWDGSTLTEMTDADLGVPIDMLWIGGYFMLTDGTDVYVTDLTDRMSITNDKYASNEANPDPIVALVRLRNEVYALNRFTTEVFDNVGVTSALPTAFPFAVIEGAQIQKGCIGTHACCVFLEAVAFLGSGFNEAPGVYLGLNGATQKLSTIEIDKLLATYTELELSTVVVETRNDNAHQHLYIHLPDRCIVYDHVATQALSKPVWYTLTSSLVDFSTYRARFFTWCYDRWIAGDPTEDVTTTFGELTEDTGAHWGEPVRWEFSTQMLYNEGKGAVIKALELVALSGRVAVGSNPQISTAYSFDGMTWSTARVINAGTTGQRNKRLAWFRLGHFRDQRIQRFNGDSAAHISFARLEADVEPMEW
jgi:hypothetical protein